MLYVFKPSVFKQYIGSQLKDGGHLTLSNVKVAYCWIEPLELFGQLLDYLQFLIFINDITLVNCSKGLLYADIQTVFSSISRRARWSNGTISAFQSEVPGFESGFGIEVCHRFFNVNTP